MDGLRAVGADVTSLAKLDQSMKANELGAQVGVALLKQSMDMQKEMAAQLMQMIGVGQNIDIEA